MRRGALGPALALTVACANTQSTDSGVGFDDTGATTVTGGGDGADGTSGADGTAGPVDYEVFDGFQAYDVYGVGSSTADLCQLTWLLSGRPVTETCPDCVWTFLVTGNYDADLSTPGVCPEPANFTLTLAFDGETLSYEYGGGLVPWGTVDLWDPRTEPALLASTTTENNGYTYLTRIQADVR